MPELKGIERTAFILDLVAGDPAGVTTGTIQQRAWLTDSTAYRELKQLEDLGWLEQRRGRWIIGPKLGGYFRDYIAAVVSSAQLDIDNVKQLFNELFTPGVNNAGTERPDTNTD